MFRKAVLALSVTATIAGVGLASTTPAEAHWVHRSWGHHYFHGGPVFGYGPAYYGGYEECRWIRRGWWHGVWHRHWVRVCD
jgi:hypothetical protein